MKKILITGISGFVGGHFCNYLATRRNDVELYGISRSEPAWNFLPPTDTTVSRVHFTRADLTNGPKTREMIRAIEPDYVLHLAARSSVAESWKTPADTFLANSTMFLNVVESVRRDALSCRVLSVGSSEQYGIVAGQDLPLREDRVMAPVNPYAAARVAQEHLAKMYAEGYSVDICCTRSFNHCGPGQSPRFVISSIVLQFVRAMQGKQEPEIRIGNGSIVRDFLDVRDVVAAYLLLLEHGRSGEVYNVCSGQGHAIRDVIHLLSALYDVPVSIVEEQDRLRPVDNPRITGSYDKIQQELGWHPVIPFEETLRSMVEYWIVHGENSRLQP